MRSIQAQNTENMSKVNLKVTALLTQAIALLGGEAAEAPAAAPAAVELTAKLLKAKPAAQRAALVAKGVDVEDLDDEDVASLLEVAVAIVTDDVEELEKDAVHALAKQVGVQPSKKLAGTIAELKTALTAEAEAEAEPEVEAEEADAEPEAEAEAEEEVVSPKEQKARLAAYNAVAKNKLPNYDALLAKLDGNPWGKAYVKEVDDKVTAYCCGLSVKTDPEDEDVGICRVTGKRFKETDGGDLGEIDEDGEFVTEAEPEAEEEEKPKAGKGAKPAAKPGKKKPAVDDEED